jgi:hypothetical protein
MSSESSTRRVQLDFLANVVTITTCLIVCALALSRWVSRPEEQVDPLPIGTAVPIAAGYPFGSADRTLIFGTRLTCRYCVDSMPNFAEVVRAVSPLIRNGKIRVVVVSADPPEAVGKDLSARGLGLLEQARVDRSSPLVRATPTVVVAGRDGLIRASWVGLVDRARASEILAAMR